ncbi:MAG: tRNA uridine-5-carboxymethylaminomethyl(34) synthesis GTPase MnmE [Bacteroidales bacterium]|nr:tRNA uridine-5-carboxymethylaminomethyl(34) synthesis GTPase MnmE [Bacteroidales bacterium]
MINIDDIIYAPASGSGGAISIIRLSGNGCVELAGSLLQLRRGRLEDAPGYSLHFANVPGIDDVLVSVFRAPKSYTGEDMVEISCHASPFVQSELMRLLSEAGARLAEPGEFTRRAFLSGKMDLAQAEAVADIISSSSSAQHRVAFNQLKGGFSNELSEIRVSLLELTALMELELDFSEEDVEFADRGKLRTLLDGAVAKCKRLADSFRIGNALRNGVPVAIVGAPNSGKSTLLNALLNDDRAIVSDIPGTTRDTVEETCIVGGILFRFIDTAGIRSATDEIERLGIERTMKKASEADIILGLIDASNIHDQGSFEASARSIYSLVDTGHQKLILLLNKSDIWMVNKNVKLLNNFVLPADIQSNGVTLLEISAKTGFGLEKLRESLVSASGIASEVGTLVTNARHAQALSDTAAALEKVRSGMNSGLPSDLLSEDLRTALFHLGSITGQITTDEVLGEIFSKFCIGK